MFRNIKNSQNFLRDRVLVQNLIKLSNINHNDFVIEIGPGKGIITDVLSNSCKKLLAIEYDYELYKILHSRFLVSKKVTVLHQDFLKTNLPSFPYKVFSNIPFNMTADILNKLLNAYNPPVDMYLVMQKEAVFKHTGEPYYDNCLKSLGLKPIYDIKIIHHFSPRDFYPCPRAQIVLAHFHKKSSCDIDVLSITDWQDFLAFVFTARGEYIQQKIAMIFSRRQITRLLQDIDVNKCAHLRQLSYKQWLGMFNAYKTMVPFNKRQIVKGAHMRLVIKQEKINKWHKNRKAV